MRRGVESEEKKMINNVFDFGDAVAKDVMVPRIDMVHGRCKRNLLMSSWSCSRMNALPVSRVYEENTDNVIGIVNMEGFYSV